MVTCQVRTPAKSSRARSDPTRPSDSDRLRERATSRSRWTPCPEWLIWGRHGTRKLSNTSTNPPEESGTTRATGLTARAGRSPAVVPAPRLQAGEQGGGGALSLLFTKAITDRNASFPAAALARTSNVWNSFVRSKVVHGEAYG